VAGGAAYAATLPVLREADGTIRLRVAVNPRAHTLDTVRVLFAPHGPGARYSQMGRGVGKYDAKTGRYYFNATYQKVRDTADGGSFGDDPQEIAGWVHPGTNTAALVHRVAQ